MMFTYWPPSAQQPCSLLLAQQPLRCALSLGDLPDQQHLVDMAWLPACPSSSTFAPHSFPTPSSSKRRDGGIQQCCQPKPRQQPSTAAAAANRNDGPAEVTGTTVLARSVGTQTAADEPREEVEAKQQGMEEETTDEEEEEEDEELSLLCADIAQCLLQMADRWAVNKLQRHKGHQQQSAAKSIGLWAWLRAKLIG